MRNILLIGFMGSGKSTVSKELSKMLDLEEIDTDARIEKQEGMTISEIFEKRGEVSFRECETNLLKELVLKDNLLLSCGGGMALREENRELMKKLGTVVLLKAKPETILSRVQGNTERPILNGNMNVSYIQSLMDKRCPLYEKASDIMVTTDEKDIKEICKEIIKKLAIS